MPAIFPGRVPHEVRSDNGVLVNNGPGTVYYGDSPDVSVETAEGFIAPGQTVPVSGTLWLVSTERTDADVLSVPPTVTPTPTSGVVLPYTIPGDLSVAAGNVPVFPPTAGRNLSVTIGVGTLPTAQPVVVDLNRNGTTVFSNQANRPAAGPVARTSGVVFPNTTALQLGDYFTVDVDQVGVQTLTPNPTYVNTLTQLATTNVTTYAVSRPAGMQAGDLHIVSLGSRGSSVWSPPGGQGWNTFAAPILGASMSPQQTIYSFWRLDTGVNQQFTFTADVLSARAYAVSVALRSVHQTTPVDVTATASAASGTSFSFPAVTSTVANTMMTGFGTFDANSPSSAAPTGYTARFGFDGTSSSVRIADKIQAAAGASGTPTFTNVGASAGALIQAAIRPPDPPAQWTPGKDLTVLLRYQEV